MNGPFKHNSSAIKADLITSHDNSNTNESQSFSEKKTEPSQKSMKMNDSLKYNNSSVKTNSDDNSNTNESQSFSEKNTETSQKNIKNKKFHFVDGQEIRERRKKISQDSPSSPSTHSTSRTVNLFYQPRNVVIAFSAIILIVAVIWLMPIKSGSPSTFFKKFAGTTNDIMKDVNSIELPAANAVMEHTVACRRAANLVQRSIAFEAHGVQIAEGLREFGERINDAGNLLKNMYSKGSAVYVSFDIEIEAMMSRLSSQRRQLGDTKYFKERLNSLITKIREFRALVGKTHLSIIDAENARNNVEGYVVDGLRDAESFVVKNNCHSVSYNDVNCHSIEVAKKELKVVNDILDHLYNTADHLDNMEKILRNYEDKLMDVSAELESAGSGDLDVFEVTKADLKFLKHAIDNSKACLRKFERLSG